MVITDPPYDRAKTPENELKISARKCDPHPLPFRRKHPRIADIAIERGIEVNEHEAHFLHLAAEITARQTVRELMHCRDTERDDPHKQKSVQIQQARHAACESVPMQPCHD